MYAGYREKNAEFIGHEVGKQFVKVLIVISMMRCKCFHRYYHRSI